MSYRGRPSARRLLGLGGVASVVVWALLVDRHGGGALTAGVLYVLPAAVLALVLTCGRYPGEQVLERLRRTSPRRRPHPASSPPPRRRPVALPGGGRLIALSLAGRAPPLAAGC